MYEHLDFLIQQRIRQGYQNFFNINAGEVAQEAKVLSGGYDSWRLIDRRLQAMRKKGVIRYTRANGWQIVGAGK